MKVFIFQKAHRMGMAAFMRLFLQNQQPIDPMFKNNPFFASMAIGAAVLTGNTGYDCQIITPPPIESELPINEPHSGTRHRGQRRGKHSGRSQRQVRKNRRRAHAAGYNRALK